MIETKKFAVRFSVVFVLFILTAFLVRSFEILNELLFEQLTALSIVCSALVWVAEKAFISSKESTPEQPSLAGYRYIVICLLVFTLAQSSLLNIDRSRSFYVLAWVDQAKVIKDNEKIVLLDIFSEEGIALKPIQDRVLEQEKRGLLTVNDEIYTLTQRGRFVLWFANHLGRIYNLTMWDKNRF